MFGMFTLSGHDFSSSLELLPQVNRARTDWMARVVKLFERKELISVNWKSGFN